MKKIISQKTELKDTSVIWLDTNIQQLKSFNNGEWVSLGGSSEDTIKLIKNGDLEIITPKVLKSDEYEDSYYYEPIQCKEDSYLYLPGNPSMWEINNSLPNTILGDYCLVPLLKDTVYNITYRSIENFPNIYIGSTIGEKNIIDALTTNVIANFYFGIGNNSNPSTFTNANIKVNDVILFSDCMVKITAVQGGQYDQRFLCEPVTVWSIHTNKFVTYTITGTTYIDGMLPTLSLNISLTNDSSSTDTPYILFYLKDSSATISEYYQDCDLNFYTEDYPEVPKETDLLEGYSLVDMGANISSSFKYLFTSFERDNPPIQESSSVLSTQALSATYAYRAGDYLLTYSERKSTWRIRKDSSTAVASSLVVPTINVDFNSTDNITARKEISVTSNCLGGLIQAVMTSVPTNTNIVGYKVAFADNVMGIVTSASKIPTEQSSTDLLTTKNNGIAVNAIDQPTYMYYITYGGKNFVIGANVIDDIWSVEANVSN